MGLASVFGYFFCFGVLQPLCVPKLSGKMNRRERAICARFKELRERIKMPQPYLAKLTGLSIDQLASVEYGRTPLRYSVAWKLMVLSGVSMAWLSSEEYWPNAVFNDQVMPRPDATGCGTNPLFSEVYDSVFGKPENRREHRDPEPKLPHVPEAELEIRAQYLLSVRSELEGWFSSLPDGAAEAFEKALRDFTDEYFSKIELPTKEVWRARYESLVWYQMRREIGLKQFWSEKAGKSDLTETESTDLLAAMKPQLPSVLDRVKRAAVAPGAKSQLADFLTEATKRTVPLASVSRWLSGEREPGGEVALLLDAWATAHGFPREQ